MNIWFTDEFMKIFIKYFHRNQLEILTVFNYEFFES